MITIVGAGLVGSLWALLLRQRGFEVSLFERRPDLRKFQIDGGRSINLVLTSRGLHGLEKAGLLSEGKKKAVCVYGRMIHARSGETSYQPYGQMNECNYSISRTELNKFLLNEAEKAGAQVFFEHELSTLDPESKRVEFFTPHGLKSYPYTTLFGADGSGSRVRKSLSQLFGKEISERTDWLEADYKELTLPLKADGTAALKTSALHIWPRGAHMMMALANLDGSFTVTVYLPKTSTGPWSFDKVKVVANVKELFESEFPDAIPLMPQYLNEFMEHPQGALGTVRCSKWTFNQSIALMGDAAHAIVPFFGQGMNAGFEDCTLLLSLLEKYGTDWGKIFSVYDSQQRPNANAIADMALENWVEMRDRVGDPQFLLRKKIESSLELRYPGLFKSRYGLITYTLVPYSEAQAEGLRQNKILDQLTAGVSDISEVNWDLAEQLLK